MPVHSNLFERYWAYHSRQSVKLARTIADLAGTEDIRTAHNAEAIQHRPRRQV